MKKLRLIKPWQLRTIRQRLCDERSTVQEVGHTFTPCLGPAADASYCSLLEATNFRVGNMICENPHFALKAPISNHIFASANIRG